MSDASAYSVPLRFKLLRPFLKTLFRGIFRALARITITGKENIPCGQPYIAAINHVSIFDPPFAAAFWPEMLEIIGAIDVFSKPGQGQLLRLYGVIPVYRGEYDRALFTRLIAILRSGRPLLIAPEGARSHRPGMQRARPGVAYLVEKTGVVVVPVGIVGTTEDFWQRARRGDRPPLEMHIGKPLRLPAITAHGAEKHEARQSNADLVMTQIAGLLPEDYRGVYAGSVLSAA